MIKYVKFLNPFFILLITINLSANSDYLKNRMKNDTKNIAAMSVNSVYNLDSNDLFKILKSVVENNKDIKALRITENLEEKTMFTFYRKDGEVFFNKLIPTDIQTAKIQQPLYYGKENIGKIELYYYNKSESNLKYLLTNIERAYLKEEKKIITMCIDPKWMPFEQFDKKGKYVGMSADYYKIFENMLSTKIKVIKSTSWSESIELAKERKCDIMSLVMETPSRRDFLEFTTPYLKVPLVFATGLKVQFINEIDELKGKKIGVAKGYAFAEILKIKYPYLNIIEVDNIDDGLDKVISGKLYTYVGTLQAVGYKFQTKYSEELKISGKLENIWELGTAVRNDDMMLFSIMEKITRSISEEQKRKILNKWISIKYEKGFDYSLFWKIISVIFILILLIIYWNQKLRKMVNVKTEELQILNKNLKNQKQTFQALFENSNDGVLLLDDGIIYNCNNAVLKIFQLEKNKLVGKSPSEISPLEQRGNINSKVKAKEHIDKCLKNGFITFEWIHKKANEEEFEAEVTLSKIRVNNRDIIHALVRDISEKKRLVEEVINKDKMLLEQSKKSRENLEKRVIKRTKEISLKNKELEKSYSELKQTQEQLVESKKMASLGRLVAGVAHEINTPVGIGITGITYLSGRVEEIEIKYNNEDISSEEFEFFLKESKSICSQIDINLARTAELVRSFKQISVDQTRENIREFNLSEYIKEVLLSISNITQKTNLNILVECDNKLKIKSYPGAFSQVISNLIINSINHGFEKKEKGNIIIKVLQENSKLKLIYKDNGKGIKEKDLKKIFEPFFTTKRESGGTGLGLNIIYNIVTSKLNGKISCNSEKHKGVEFIIEIPTSS